MNHGGYELAWPGAEASGRLSFNKPVPSGIAQIILDTLKNLSMVDINSDYNLTALRSPRGPVGRYRLESSEKSWFVRVTSRRGNANLEKAISSYAFEQGCSVNPIDATTETAISGQHYRIDIRPFLNGRHFNGSPSDLKNLATELATLHKSLATYPKSVTVQQNAAKRFARLEQRRDEMKNVLKKGDFKRLGTMCDWASLHQEWLNELVHNTDLLFYKKEGSQCLHGEVHPGNVVFLDNRAVFVDFEESVHIYAPPAWDLAYLVQRFCIKRNATSPMTKLLDAVRSCYGDLPPLSEMMRQLAWYAVIVAFDIQCLEHTIIPHEELDKFVRLEQQASVLKDLL